MKIKIKVLITTAMLCLVSIVAMANELSVFSVKIADKNTIALQLSNVIQNQIQVVLKDSDGFTLHVETLDLSDLNQRKYDLSTLPSGSYTLMVTYDDIIKVQTINKKYKTLEIAAEDLQTIFHPTFRQHSKFVDLNMIALSDQKVHLKIRDGEGRLIYDESNQLNGSFQKRFNLSQLDEGSYTFVVEIVGDNINKEFKEFVNWSPKLAAL